MWGACDPKNPKNTRLRCSALIRRTAVGDSFDQQTVCIIDTRPDFRQQMLANDVRRVDGVLYTHEHADHIHGIDDLRPFAIGMRKRIPVHVTDSANARLQEAFGYCFETPEGSNYPPILDRHALQPTRTVDVTGPGGPIRCLPIPVAHGDIEALGFRIGDVAYLPDLNGLDALAKSKLTNLDILVIDALRYTTHPSHFNVDQALKVHAELAPRRTILTNLHTDLDYQTLSENTPDDVEPAYDGMSFDVAGHE